MRVTCEDADKGCKHCHGGCKKEPTMALYRCDMIDNTGTMFCDECGTDAMESLHS